MKKFRVYMEKLTIEAESRDEAYEQLGEMVEGDPCALFQVEEIKTKVRKN